MISAKATLFSALIVIIAVTSNQQLRRSRIDYDKKSKMARFITRSQATRNRPDLTEISL